MRGSIGGTVKDKPEETKKPSSAVSEPRGESAPGLTSARGGTERPNARPYAEQWLKIHMPTYAGAQLDSLEALLDAYAKQ